MSCLIFDSKLIPSICPHPNLKDSADKIHCLSTKSPLHAINVSEPCTPRKPICVKKIHRILQ